MWRARWRRLSSLEAVLPDLYVYRGIAPCPASGERAGSTDLESFFVYTYLYAVGLYEIDMLRIGHPARVKD